MTKFVELRRHTASDGDFLTPEGVETAVQIGTKLDADYKLFISSGAQRATQTAGCFIAGMGLPVPGGVTVDQRFRSSVEERWSDAYERAGSGDIESFRRVDPELVENESALLSRALKDIFDRLPDGGRALIVGHSPMQEAAVHGLTGEAVDPIKKGAGVLVVEDDEAGHRIEPLV